MNEPRDYMGCSGVSSIKNLPATQETWVLSLGWENPMVKEMATHSSILAWEILWTEESGEIQPMRSQRVRHNWAIKQQWQGLSHLVKLVRQISYKVIHMWNLEKEYKWTYLQNKNRLTDIENKLMFNKAKVRRDKRGVRDCQIQTIILNYFKNTFNIILKLLLHNNIM